MYDRKVHRVGNRDRIEGDVSSAWKSAAMAQGFSKLKKR